MFLALAEELHFGRAAERLRLSRSRVSQSLQTLERRVGGRLLERSTRSVRLTPLGHQLLAEFRPAYEQLQRGLREARRATDVGADMLRVGFATVLFPEIADEVTAALRRTSTGGREVVPSWHPPNDLYRWMERGDFEVGLFFSWFPEMPAAVPDGLELGAPVRREPRGVMMPLRHPLAGRQQIDVEELADHDVLHPSGHHAHADAWCPARTPGGRPIRRVHRMGQYMEDLPRVMADGDLLHMTIASMPELYPVPGTTTVPLVGLAPIACRPVWPRAEDSSLHRAVAAVAAGVGADRGWLLRDQVDSS